MKGIGQAVAIHIIMIVIENSPKSLKAIKNHQKSSLKFGNSIENYECSLLDIFCGVLIKLANEYIVREKSIFEFSLDGLEDIERQVLALLLSSVKRCIWITSTRISEFIICIWHDIVCEIANKV